MDFEGVQFQTSDFKFKAIQHFQKLISYLLQELCMENSSE